MRRIKRVDERASPCRNCEDRLRVYCTQKLRQGFVIEYDWKYNSCHIYKLRGLVNE